MRYVLAPMDMDAVNAANPAAEVAISTVIVETDYGQGSKRSAVNRNNKTRTDEVWEVANTCRRMWMVSR